MNKIMRRSCTVLIPCLWVTLHTNAIAGNVVPEGWTAFSKCNKPNYEVGIDNKIFRSAPKSYYVEINDSTGLKARDACGMYQNIDASKYVGQRVRISAFLKGESITGDGYLISNAINSQGETLAGASTNIKGTTDWRKVTLVFDVSNSVSTVYLDFSLWGQQGKLWIDDISGPEVVDKDTPLQNAYPPTPDNLQNRP